MRIGIPKEIKNNENGVAITPAGVQELRSLCLHRAQRWCCERRFYVPGWAQA
jgi:hypothetical protein